MDIQTVNALGRWYEENRRDLPWRHTRDPYRIWVSEIMLQQTRVEAVRAYYGRFLSALPDVQALASCPEDTLLKLWEGLGYYSRARNLKKAAESICGQCGGSFPDTAAALGKLPGIGSYTAGAVASIAYGERVPAVDGNVLRVWARYRCSGDNILQPAFRRRTEGEVSAVLAAIPEDLFTIEGTAAGLFNQSLIELGALVCLPNAAPKCGDCPLAPSCAAHAAGRERELPVRATKQRRRVEERTVLLVLSPGGAAIRRRPEKGLLAGMYEFPNLPGHIPEGEAVAYVKKNGYDALRVVPLPPASHVFSHVEWKMTGYEIRVSEPADPGHPWIFAETEELRGKRAIPAAFSAYAKHISLALGAEALRGGED